MTNEEKILLAQWADALADLLDDKSVIPAKRIGYAKQELRSWAAAARGKDTLTLDQSLKAGALLVRNGHDRMRKDSGDG